MLKPRRIKKCRTCGTTDQEKFYADTVLCCRKCRGVENGKARATRLGVLSANRAKVEAVKRANLCLEGDMKVSSFDSFARTCRARRGSFTALMVQSSECRFCSAHKLVADGKLPKNISLISATQVKAMAKGLRGRKQP